MSRIGIFGGMGPSATVDFMDKLVQLTPATRDQEHLPVIVASLPHIPDRSRAIMGQGLDPLPRLLEGIAFLNQVGVGVVAIPCNSSHHWYDQLSAASQAPILHIAQSCVAALGDEPGQRVAIFATRGALASGFYQRALADRGIGTFVPSASGGQMLVDECVRAVKAGDMRASGTALGHALGEAREQGVTAVIMGCTEIPIAARHTDSRGLRLVDSSLELARAVVNYGVERGWNKPGWVC
ncbi:MAG: amino acid racemase [Pseudomonadota bacterium]